MQTVQAQAVAGLQDGRPVSYWAAVIRHCQSEHCELCDGLLDIYRYNLALVSTRTTPKSTQRSPEV